jgi:hypothetical protein
MKRVSAMLLCALMAASLAGCVVAPAGPGPHSRAHWVPGACGPYGGWHPGHWQ